MVTEDPGLPLPSKLSWDRFAGNVRLVVPRVIVVPWSDAPFTLVVSVPTELTETVEDATAPVTLTDEFEPVPPR